MVAAFTLMKISKPFLFLIFLFLFAACTEEEPRPPIPYVPVNIEINLQDLRYQSLHNEGWLYLEGGYRGIILIKDGPNVYRALERACPYHPTDPCAKVEMHSSSLYLFDACCDSHFSKLGNVTSGPAQHPLLQYNTYQSGTNYLVISN